MSGLGLAGGGGALGAAGGGFGAGLLGFGLVLIAPGGAAAFRAFDAALEEVHDVDGAVVHIGIGLARDGGGGGELAGGDLLLDPLAEFFAVLVVVLLGLPVVGHGIDE